MARMSIDDMISRDPRITMLAQALGWSRRETLGCLVGDIWPIAYDQRAWLLSEKVIDAAAGRVGFAAAMADCDLARRARGGKFAISGARERIEYLNKKKDAGHVGGIKSAESREKNSSKSQARASGVLEHGGSTPQARGNPIVPDTATAPDAALSPPADPPERESPAVAAAAIRSGQHAGFDPEVPGHRAALAEWTWTEISRRRGSLAREFGSVLPLPLAPITPATHPPAFRELLARVREEGATAPAICLHVIEAATVHARKERSVEWVGEKLCTEGGWRWARGQVPTWRTATSSAKEPEYAIVAGQRVLL
jgi:hypothetical protein